MRAALLAPLLLAAAACGREYRENYSFTPAGLGTPCAQTSHEQAWCMKETGPGSNVYAPDVCGLPCPHATFTCYSAAGQTEACTMDDPSDVR